MANLQVFISHSHWDAALAAAWKDLLVGVSGGAIDVWLSSDASAADGVPFGKEWRAVVYEQLNTAGVVLAVLTPESIRHPWLWWECGVARGLDETRSPETRRLVIPVLHGIESVALVGPMNEYQLVEADKPGQVEKLCSQLLEQIAPHPGAHDLSAHVATFQQHRQVRRAVRGRILVDLSHGQADWNWFRGTRPSILELDWLRTRVESTLTVDAIQHDEITADRLAPCAGLIVPIPREASLSARVREAIVSWVLEGGRLLLLGYELGDYHHRSNLNALALSFGLHFESDIVARSTAKSGDPRNHGQELMFDVRAGHPVTAGLSQIPLTNVQTVRAEPGAQPLIVVGSNLVGRPSNDPGAVRYETGKWVLVAPERLEYAPALLSQAVLVAAPPGLTGKGHVLGLGTWWTGAGPETDLFLRNLLRWLGDLA